MLSIHDGTKVLPEPRKHLAGTLGWMLSIHANL
jgi:hypothetical protein